MALSPPTEVLAHFDAQFPQHGAHPAQAMRQQGIARVRTLGWPDNKNEAWKNTKLGAWVDTLHQSPAHGDEAAAKALLPQTDNACARLVFINGRFCASLSDLEGPTGLTVGGLKDAWQRDKAILEAHLGSTGAHQDAPLTALNTAMWEDGAVVHVAANVSIDAPIEIVFIAVAAGPSCVQPRVLFVGERSSAATVVETYVSEAGSKHLTNVVTEIIAGDNACLQHYVQQDEAATAGHLGTLCARLGRDSQVHAAVLTTGSKLARREVRMLLAAPGGHCAVSGLSLCRGEQHADTQVNVEHQSPHCKSEQTFTNIVDDRSSAIFSGKVVVAPHAIKTDAQQLNKNLLLSAQATAHTRPQLEILADDVKCSHGATVGQLDEDALFYLRSRGLDISQARQLLTYAFASNVLSAVLHTGVRARFAECARLWLGLGAVGESP